MSAPSVLESSLRDVLSEVVRAEVRAVLQEVATAHALRNSAGESYFSVSKAARFADVAPGTIRRWIRTGRLQTRRAGRVYRIGREDLEEFMRRQGRDGKVVDQAREIVRARAA